MDLIASCNKNVRDLEHLSTTKKQTFKHRYISHTYFLIKTKGNEMADTNHRSSGLFFGGQCKYLGTRKSYFKNRNTGGTNPTICTIFLQTL